MLHRADFHLDNVKKEFWSEVQPLFFIALWRWAAFINKPKMAESFIKLALAPSKNITQRWDNTWLFGPLETLQMLQKIKNIKRKMIYFNLFVSQFLRTEDHINRWNLFKAGKTEGWRSSLHGACSGLHLCDLLSHMYQSLKHNTFPFLSHFT